MFVSWSGSASERSLGSTGGQFAIASTSRVARVHDDRGRVLRHVLVADVAEDLLGIGLDPAVDRELDVVAGGGAGDDVAVDLLAERVLGDRDLAVGPREHVVLGLLDAEQPLASSRWRRSPPRVLALRVDAAESGRIPIPSSPSFSMRSAVTTSTLLCDVREAALRGQRASRMSLSGTSSTEASFFASFGGFLT